MVFKKLKCYKRSFLVLKMVLIAIDAANLDAIDLKRFVITCNYFYVGKVFNHAS